MLADQKIGARDVGIAPRRRMAKPALALLLAATLLGGCVYNPYTGTYEPGVVAAPAYGYGYAPAYVYAPPVVVGGGWGGGWGGWHGGGPYFRR